MTTTVAEYIARLSARFDDADLCYGHGTDNPTDEAFYLVFAALGLPFEQADELAGHPLDDGQKELLDTLAARRIKERVPVAYLVGQAWFAGHAFYVGPEVLVPRSPIAELITRGFQPMLKKPPARVLDLCTGSGCIGISCALAFPRAAVTLSDISPAALTMAKRNVDRHGVSGRTQICQSDLFSDLQGSWDLVISNPPYVSRDEVDELPAEYHHEPALGLLSEDDGLAIPVAILETAAEYLNDGGWLILELGLSWPVLVKRYPRIPFLWLEFDNGGEGVLAISKSDLQRWF